MSFRKLFYFLVLFAFSGLLTSCSSNNENRESRILIFSKTTGFSHASIQDGIKALQASGARNNVVVDTTENAENFNEENLKRYDAVVFLNTTGDILDHYQKAEFERYIQA
ncbi:MAG: ThuA domain-containing protein, partial [Bacteroidota bacterium]|nr:ThuA domain-containing protein [Bacteroidota bacterium]